MDKYRLTPHKITICVLVEYYLNGNINYHQKQSLSHLLIRHIKENNYKDIESEITLYEFIEKELKYVLPIQWINNEFLRMIQFDSVDDIHQFMTSLKELFNNNNDDIDNDNNNLKQMQILDSKSILGIFIKKVILNFNQILFDGLIKLYDQLDQYLNEFYFEIDKIQKQSNMEQDMEDVEDVGEVEGALTNYQDIKSKFLSPLDEERFIYEETIRINSMIGKGENPKEIEKQINQLKISLPNVKRVHLISLLFNIGYQDYDSSLEDLHRYFDYVNGQITGNIKSINNQDLNNNNNNDTTNLMLPYAVLNLVRLHYHFGHYEESYLALREAIRIAQERGDHSCLALADHWLARLLKKSIYNSMESSSSSLLLSLLSSHSDSEILKKSIDKSRDLEMPDLQALNHTAFSKYKLENGELSSPYSSYDQTTTTNTTNTTKSLSDGGGGVNMFGKSFHLWNDIFQPIEISRLLDKSSSNATIAHHLYSTSWELLGNMNLAQFFTELAMKSYQSNDLSLQHDPLRAINNNNSNFNNTTSSNTTTINSFSQQSPQQPPDIISYCKLSLMYSKKSKYNEALQILIKCFSIYKTQHLCGNLLTFTILSILFDYLITTTTTTTTTTSNNNNDLISIIIESLISLTNRFQSEDSIEGPGWNQILICYQKLVKYYCKIRGMYEKATNLILKGIQISKDFGLDSQIPYFYSLLSKIYNENSKSYRFNGLSDTLSALSLSNSYHLSNSIADSNLDLIKIHLSTDKLEKAITLIKETLPLVLSDQNLVSQLYCLWAKSIISSNQLQAIEYLNRSEQNTSSSNSELLKEIYYLKSLIYNNLNDTKNRNLYAKKFKSIIIPSNNSPPPPSPTIETTKIGLIPPILVNPMMKIR